MLLMPNASPAAMHIPDGFLSTLVSIVFWIISAFVFTIALRKTNQELEDRQVPLMGIMAAAIFAGQMLNFSIAGGTSGHLLGAALATILLGPWPAILVMSSVVSLQALLFQDGGILALGANIFNMAVVGVFVSYTVYIFLKNLFKNRPWEILVSGFTAAWFSIFIASLSCALQLAVSGTSPANVAIPAMGAIHALIGIGEGLITLGALTFLLASRKDLLGIGEGKPAGNKGVLIGGSLITLVLAGLSPLASSFPDGLEKFAEQNGFINSAKNAFYNLIPDYVMPGINNPALATIGAGILGAIIVFGIAFGLAHSRKKASVVNTPQR